MSHEDKINYILRQIEGVNIQGIQQYCTNLYNNLTANPPATEQKLNEAVKSFVTRADVEKIVQSLPEVSDLRTKIDGVKSEMHQKMASQADDVEENLKLYLTMENFSKILAELTERMIEKQKERVEAERVKVDTKLQQHALNQKKEFESKLLENQTKLKLDVIETLKSDFPKIFSHAWDSVKIEKSF